MHTSDAGYEVIEKCFSSIGGVKSFTSFGRLTTEQIACRDYLQERRDDLGENKSRDLHLSELMVCISGADEDDADEPLSEACFSQYRFYRTYIHDLIYYPEKFDFLVRCIEESVCVVKMTSRFRILLDRICKNNKVQQLPREVVDYDQLLEEDEERRIESFTLRKDWQCTVPPIVGGADDAMVRIAAAAAAAEREDKS